MTVALMYHHISPLPGPHTVSPDNFRKHLSYLDSRRIKTLSLAEFEQRMSGAANIGEGPSVLLTFDDAWLDNWVYALPILQEFSAKAVFFTVTSWPGEGDAREEPLGNSAWSPPSHAECMALAGTSEQDAVSMRWAELLAAKETGLVDIASHSHSHGHWWEHSESWEKSLRELKEDLRQSRARLADKLGVDSDHLCWPKGFFGKSSMDIAREVGFQTQYSTLRGGNLPGKERLVRRIDAENRGPDWLHKRLSLYGNPLAGQLLGLAHQNLHRSRMKKQFPSVPAEEFDFPVFRPI